MKKITLLVAIIATIGIKSFSQSTYDRAIGIRISESYYDIAAVSYKFFVSSPGALELNGGFGAKTYSIIGKSYGAFALNASLAYQHHFNVASVDGLKWYIGGGAIVYNVFSDRDEYKGFAFGIFPTGGIDYKFSRIPLNVSADYRPTIFLGRPDGNEVFFGTNFGVSARYTINKK